MNCYSLHLPLPRLREQLESSGSEDGLPRSLFLRRRRKVSFFFLPIFKQDELGVWLQHDRNANVHLDTDAYAVVPFVLPRRAELKGRFAPLIFLDHDQTVIRPATRHLSSFLALYKLLL
jgi:hypothetical protein